MNANDLAGLKIPRPKPSNAHAQAAWVMERGLRNAHE